MAKSRAGKSKNQLHETGDQALEAAQAKKAGSDFEWHFGRVTRLGNYSVAGGRSVTISWDAGGVSSLQGSITDDQWELFKLAFQTTGRIAILSDASGDDAFYDYRFLEVVR